MYRENIYDLIRAVEQREGVKIPTLVVPKNSGLKGYVWKVLKEAGLDLEKAKKISETELIAENLDVLLRRGEDIPQIVTDEFRLGRTVLGVTGDDLLDEYRLRNPQNTLLVENTYDWFDTRAKYYRPALCLIGRNNIPEDMPLEARVALNAKYEYTSRLELSKSARFGGRSFLLTVYSGDVEAQVQSNTNDCGIDTVYSGDSIKNRKLLEIGEPLRFTDLVVVSPFWKNGMRLWEMGAKEIQKGSIIDRAPR